MVLNVDLRVTFLLLLLTPSNLVTVITHCILQLVIHTIYSSNLCCI